MHYTIARRQVSQICYLIGIQSAIEYVGLVEFAVEVFDALFIEITDLTYRQSSSIGIAAAEVECPS